MKRGTIILLAVSACVLTACSTVKGLTGQQDNTILPGQREDILPPDQQTARDPVITGQTPADSDVGGTSQPCDPNSPDCLSPVDPIDQDAPGQQ